MVFLENLQFYALSFCRYACDDHLRSASILKNFSEKNSRSTHHLGRFYIKNDVKKTNRTKRMYTLCTQCYSILHIFKKSVGKCLKSSFVIRREPYFFIPCLLPKFCPLTSRRYKSPSRIHNLSF